MRKNNKGFTLVELLAVIVVLAIVMGLAAVAITGVLENTRKAAMVSDAKSYINGARNLVNSSDINSMIGGTGTNYRPACTPGAAPVNIPLAALELEKGGKSPYGEEYQKGSTSDATSGSYIVASSAVDENGNCTISYSIYLTDGTYRISGGTNKTDPVAETSLSNDNVNVITTPAEGE